MLNANEARTQILDAVRPLEIVSVSIRHALGSYAAEGVTSGGNIPPFDNSAMDGYAVRAGDVRDVPVKLRVTGEIKAGDAPGRRLESGEARAIMTGAQVPEGSDAIVQHEWTEADASHVTVLRTVPVGHNIRRAGGDIPKGAAVLQPGDLIRPQEIGLLASMGRQFLNVHRKPRVAVLATGNELVEIDKPLTGAKIHNSNSHVICALLKELGCEARYLGIAPDTREELKVNVLEGLRMDALITSGGVSAGKHDLVMDVMKEVGVEIRFWKVNIRPGMPLVFGTYDGRPVFGLPGNPVSTMVTFLQFVRPALRRMMGERGASSFTLRATLEHDMKKNDGKRHFVRGILSNKNGLLSVRSTGSQLSNIMSSLSHANCLIILPEDCESIAAGNQVEVELLQ